MFKVKMDSMGYILKLIQYSLTFLSQNKLYTKQSLKTKQNKTDTGEMGIYNPQTLSMSYI